MPDSKVTPKQTIADPVGNFASHTDFVKYDTLSVKQKKDVLTKWEQHAVRLSVATEEGTSSGELAHLDDAKDVQSKLSGKAAKRPASPTKAA